MDCEIKVSGWIRYNYDSIISVVKKRYGHILSSCDYYLQILISVILNLANKSKTKLINFAHMINFLISIMQINTPKVYFRWNLLNTLIFVDNNYFIMLK